MSETLCKQCANHISVVGSAFTTRDCESCGVNVIYSSTKTDKYCTDCALALDACRHCGGALHE